MARQCLGPLSEAQWLAVRERYLTATQVCTVAGVHPYQSKTSVDKVKADARAFEPNRFTVLGTLQEPTVCQLVAYATGCRTRLVRYPDPKAKFMLTNDDIGGISCTPDALIRVPVGGPNLTNYYMFWDKSHPRGGEQLEALAGQTGLLELKTAYSGHAIKKWVSPPIHYWWQVQVQLHLCEYEWGVLAGLLPYGTLSLHIIHRDLELRETLVSMGAEMVRAG